MKIHLDFETRSAFDIDYGAWAYSCHDSTSIMCMAWAIDDGDVQVSYDTEEMLRVITKAHADGATFVAHNAAFEYAICKNVLNFEVPVDRWRCTAALCAYYSLPRALGNAAKALNLSKLKDEDGRKIMLKMSKPVPKRYRGTKGMWYEDEEDFDKLLSYCMDDVETERALEEALPPLPETEQKVWELDQVINLRGLCVDVDLCKAAIKIRDDNYDRLISECKEITGGVSPSQTKKLAEWLGVASVAKDCLQELMDNADCAETLRVLQIRQEFAASSLAKFDAALGWQVDGRVRGSLLYHGAKTGRWTGKGVQFQNVPRGSIRTDESNKLLAKMIKDAIE